MIGNPEHSLTLHPTHPLRPITSHFCLINPPSPSPALPHPASHHQCERHMCITPKVISKVNVRLKFLHRKDKYLTPNQRRLLCNASIQLHFDYACSAWYPNLSKKLRNRTQTSQNKWIRFYLFSDKMSHISQKEFKTIN